MILQRSVGSLQGSKNSSTSNTGSALNVVIEGAVHVPVFLKESEGVLVTKVFKLNQSILSISPDNSRHELINKVIILLSCHSLVSQSDVVWVLQKFLSVGSNIKSDWQCLTWSNAGNGRVQRQFADGDSHSLSSQVSKSENSLSISDNNTSDILLGPVLENIINMTLVMDGDEQSLGSPEHQPKLLAGQTYRWSVDYWHQLFGVLGQYFVEQLLISLQQVRHVTVLVQRLFKPPQIPESMIRLVILVLHSGRQQSVDTKNLSLLNTE